jgi:hypothetical protein
MLVCGSSCTQSNDPVVPISAARGVKLPVFVQECADEAAGIEVSVPRPQPLYSRDIAPLFEHYCLHCHDHAAASGGIVLDGFGDGIPDARQTALLLRTDGALRSGSTPPEKEPHPVPEELETLTSWLDATLSRAESATQHIAIRRLNRAEYNNTIRDLIGLDLRPADEFPSDDVGYGFDNVGEVLATPPILLEMYVAAAEEVIDDAFDLSGAREHLLSPVSDSLPLAFRRYKPPVRSARENKFLRTPKAAPDPELARQQHIYDILRTFCDRAFRRPATHDELTRLIGIVLSSEKDGESFDCAMRLAFQSALASPQFLFLLPKPDHKLSSIGDRVPDTDFELAARLSYFLWRSMPDDDLYRLAARGELRIRANLHATVERMLQDWRANALAQNFASQWLQTRKLKDFMPDPTLFPGFDEPLKAAMINETELFFESIRSEDRSVLELLDADYTFVNQRLAQHYGIPGVTGDEFRRVSVAGTVRGGVLTQASILTATSNPTRTSPVKRGKWILENILGAPPSPPPSGVEALKEGNGLEASGSIRKRMERHRTDPACATCHRSMDPLGFALENFDAVGAWRTEENGRPIDSSGRLPGGREFQVPKQLKAALVSGRDAFAHCLAEKMLTYALGRGLARSDRRHVDKIVRTLACSDYRFSALVLAIVESEPFLDFRVQGESQR